MSEMQPDYRFQPFEIQAECRAYEIQPDYRLAQVELGSGAPINDLDYVTVQAIVVTVNGVPVWVI